jgi:tRNA threonylcarbamoyladenosine dehydratase
MDDICISNINRQLHALSSTIGSMKIDVLYQRLQQINPHCNVHRIYDFVSTDNIYDIFDSINANWGVPVPIHSDDYRYDIGNTNGNDNTSMIQHRVTAVLDCMDGAREKAALLAYCNHRAIPICTVGSTAGRTNPAQVTFGDITQVHTSAMGHSWDRLLTTVRKELRQQYHFIPGRPFGRKSKPWFIPCVYSEEEVTVPAQQATIPPSLRYGDTKVSSNSNTATRTSSSFRQCDNGVLGTASFVTGTFGFVAASIIVQGIAQNHLHPPRGTSTTGIHNDVQNGL